MTTRQDGRAGDGLYVPPVDQITLDEIVVSKGALPPAPGPSVSLIGWWAFRLLVVFIGMSYLALAVFAWSIYPSTVQARVEWLAVIKELGQMFVLTPFLPLLGAVLGYIFGREQRTSSGE